ncbi:MAG TPA: CDP-alcohol phosphatidyltransferase family protein [Chitinophagaceae bacterium]|nr:CDP-alcohol phosphatidyltransferase family protein [Chitinophagaceae bacterium]
MHPRSYYIINGITFYRLLAAPFLLVLVAKGEIELFRWLLVLSFLTDAIDGFLARKYKIASVLGAKLDSIADDLTVGVATIGIIIVDPNFIRQHAELILMLLGLFVIENVAAFIRYRRFTSFHTYLAKIAAVAQAAFLILFFFTGPVDFLFYLAVIITAADLVEEIILVMVLPQWQSNVHGLPWILKKSGRKTSVDNAH